MRLPDSALSTDSISTSDQQRSKAFRSVTSEVFTKPVCSVLLLLIISAVLFMTLNANGNWDFILAFRGQKLIALLVVGYAIGVSTLLFQSLTHNPILTPALLGFDALYVLIQSVLVYFLGAVNLFSSQPLLKFGLEVTLMVGASLLLFGLLFRRATHDLSRLILVGIVFGILFRSLSTLIARLINPEEFIVIQSASFAQFNTIDSTMMTVSLIICAITAVMIWRWRYQIDVLMLGRAPAINLGVDYHSLARRLLVTIAILVATATAFVGPVIFLGLLVCALTNRITYSMAHSERLILVSLIAMLCLVLGQTIFEQLLGMSGVLSIVIELLGGVVFMALIFHQYRVKQV